MYKRDANASEIVRVLLAAGCSVQSLEAVGGGVSDLLVGRNGCNYLLEIKDGSKPPSARRLTPAQKKWHMAWRGQVAVVSSPEEAIEAVGLC